MEILQLIPFLRPHPQNREQELASARRRLDVAWRELGGPSGKEVTKEQISHLLVSASRTLNVEVHAISLTEQLETAQKLDTEESLRFTDNWLTKQKIIWQKEWLLKENNYFEHLEVQRRIIACKSAIELLATPIALTSPITPNSSHP